MDIFKQNKFLMRIIIALVVMNTITIGLFLYNGAFSHGGRPMHPPPPGASNFEEVSDILANELKLSPQQQADFKTLRLTYFKKEHDLQDILRSERDSMNDELFKGKTDEQLVKEIATRISANEYKMEMLRLNQALELKKICNEEQLMLFENLVSEIRDYFKPGGPPHGMPPPPRP